MRAGWAAVKIGAALVFVCACGQRSLDGASDGGVGSVSLPNQPDGASSIGDGGSAVGGGPGSTADANAASCPAVEPAAPAAVSAAPARVPTTTPFSCAPLPAAYIFPTDGRPRGQFGRCASFEVGAAQRLAVSPDGRLVALVTADGIVRVVEIASRNVVAVVAPARASVDLVAFSPDGQGILTLAAGERELTLWRFGDPPAQAWTLRLPGHRYELRFGGGALAFSPDGRTALVSAGQQLWLIDVTTGTIRVTREASGALMDAAYGWGGRRIVVALGATVSHCSPGVHGGGVNILDADTLATVAEIADYGYWGNLHGAVDTPAFRASPTDDVVFLPSDRSGPPTMRAVRLSDGLELPTPAFDSLPLAFMPDGTHLLARGPGSVTIMNSGDGSLGASTLDFVAGPVAVSADGRVVAAGGSGPSLLTVWTVSDPWPTYVCSAPSQGEPSPYTGIVSASLTADGQTIVFGQGSHVRVVRTATGVSPVSLAVDDPDQVTHVTVSPNLRYIVASPSSPKLPTIVFSLRDAVRAALLPADNWWWTDFTFSPREDRLYATAYGSTLHQLYDASLDVPGLVPVDAAPVYTRLLGFSQGCPVLYDSTRGAWRSCGACNDPPVGGPGDIGVASTVLSPDGRLLAKRAPNPDSAVTVWPMQPGAASLRTIAPSPDDSDLNPLMEFPIAIAPGAGRVATSSFPAYSCYRGRGLGVRIHDLATGAVIDTLPPPPGYVGAGLAVDRDVRTFAYGPQLWCSDF